MKTDRYYARLLAKAAHKVMVWADTHGPVGEEWQAFASLAAALDEYDEDKGERERE